MYLLAYAYVPGVRFAYACMRFLEVEVTVLRGTHTEENRPFISIIISLIVWCCLNYGADETSLSPIMRWKIMIVQLT